MTEQDERKAKEPKEGTDKRKISQNKLRKIKIMQQTTTKEIKSKLKQKK